MDKIGSKIDPNADRGKSFNPGSPWNNSNFAQLCMNYHSGKMAMDANQRDDATGTFANVERKFDVMLRPDRMKDYPEDLRKGDAKPEVDKGYAKLKEDAHE